MCPEQTRHAARRPGSPLQASTLLSCVLVLLALAVIRGGADARQAPNEQKTLPTAEEGQKPPQAGEDRMTEGEGLTPPIQGEDAPLPPEEFGRKLIRWLGKFHPPAANFPVALLVAAAVAELLWMVRRNPLFDNASRFCLWFGALAAVVTGTLGWFMGGFRVADPDWTMTVHRWLGTATDLCALVTLALSEIGRRTGNTAVRTAFRVLLFTVALMVLATGFFGGAQIYGLHHYDWR